MTQMTKTTKTKSQVFVRVDTVMDDLQISKPLAYRLMKEMNDELKEKGYMTISGRVPRVYYHARFLGIEMQND